MGKKGTGGVYYNGKRVHDLTPDEAFEQGIPAQVYDRIDRRRKKFNDVTRRNRKNKRDEGFASIEGKK
jgi:hypothetical protein